MAMQLKNLLLTQLRRGRFQPRRHFDEPALQELAQSILHQGVIEPLIVRALVGQEDFEIIAGERRWRAAMLAGLQRVPCVIRSYTDEQTAAVSLIENIQRAELNPVEEAYAYQRLQQEFGLAQETIAQQVGKSRSHISNVLRLLTLMPLVKEQLMQGALSFGHARTLVGLSPQEQWQLASQCLRHQWSVRKLEQQIRQRKSAAQNTESEVGARADSRYLENRLAEYLGTPIVVDTDSKEGGWLKIRFYDHDTLNGLLAKMGLSPEDCS
ncbi:MAG: ParB/RepB/Spo0J family partition protein [Legionellaceae bacterium]|nr:ParB/RepB/Spo0J family partition protein [Legionellaceae bacterium]